jgi:hypothetical protein
MVAWVEEFTCSVLCESLLARELSMARRNFESRYTYAVFSLRTSETAPPRANIAKPPPSSFELPGQLATCRSNSTIPCSGSTFWT